MQFSLPAVLLLIGFTLAARAAWDHALAQWRASRKAREREIARKYPKGISKGRRAALLRRHDAGYWAREIVRGMPAARHGWRVGWRSHRIADEQARTAAARAEADHLEAAATGMRDRAAHARRAAAARAEIERLLAEGAGAGGTPPPSGGPGPLPSRAAVRAAARAATVTVLRRGDGTPVWDPPAAGAAPRPADPPGGPPSAAAGSPGAGPPGSSPPGGPAPPPREAPPPPPGEGPPPPAAPAAAEAETPAGLRARAAALRDAAGSLPIPRLRAASHAKAAELEARAAALETDPPAPCGMCPHPRHWPAPCGQCGCPHHAPAAHAAGGGPTGKATMSDATYDSVLKASKLHREQADSRHAEARTAKAAAEARLVDVRRAKEAAVALADAMNGLDVDSATLEEQLQLVDALTRAEAAAAAMMEAATLAEGANAKVAEAAGVAATGLVRRHKQLADAHRESRVKAAQRQFYQGD